MILNADNLAFLTNGFKTSFASGFRRREFDWAKFATLVPSSTAKESYAWLGQYPRLREWIGDRAVKSISQHDYTLTNKDWESTISVPRNAIEDDQYGVYAPLFEEMGYAAAEHPEKLVLDAMVAGFTSNCYDGQYMFDTDHPVGSGTASNYGGGAGAAWFLLDTSRPLKPFLYQRRKEVQLVAKQDIKDENVFMRREFVYGVDGRMVAGYGFWQQAYASKDTLNATNFDAAIAAMMAFTSDEGRPLGIMPNLLVCGPSNRAAAKALLQAEVLASGASNTNFKAVDLVVSPYLT